MTYQKLQEYNRKAEMKLKRFIQTHKRKNLLPYLKDDFEIPIDNNWLIPERILFTTDMFSVVYPEKVLKQKGLWQERCSEICRILMHYVDGINQKGKVKYGIYFLSLIEDPDEEIERRNQEEKAKMENANMGEGNANEGNQSEFEEITLTLILNRTCGGKYKHPKEFWTQLGQLFKNVVISYPDQESSYRKVGDKLRLLAYHLYVDWFELFTNAEKDKERRIKEAERIKYIEIRNEIRQKRREEWKANSVEVDFYAKKGANKDEKEEGKDEKDPQEEGKDKEEQKDQDKQADPTPNSQDNLENSNKNNEDNTIKESANEGSVATSNAFPATSTQENMSMANQTARDGTYGGDSQFNMNQPMTRMQSRNNMMNMGQQFNQGNNMNMNQQQNMQMPQNMGQGQNQNNASRLPSLASLPINNMNPQQNMMGGNMRIPSMFGNGMPMNMGFPGNNQNVFQGARMIPPNFPMGMGMMNQNNMQMMNSAMQNPMFKQGMMNQMQRPGMMPFGPNMGGFNPGMMNFGMGNQIQNPMMRGMPFNQGMGMQPPGHMGMRGNMMNPMMNKNMNTADPTQNDQYVPGSLEEHAINAITNTDYGQNIGNDLLQEDLDIENKSKDIDPGPYSLEWLLLEDETEEMFKNSSLFSPQELEMIISRTIQFEQLYLIKWTNQSYVDATWEPFSCIQQYDEILESFEIRNKMVDNERRKSLISNIQINQKLIDYLGISEKRRKNDEDDEIDNHLKLFKYRMSLFKQKKTYELYKKEKGKQPVFKKGQRLKEYQINGTNWMIKSWFDNRNVILADEMGLGKTVQTITYLHYLFTKVGVEGPFCVIAPLTTLAHWKKVCDEWTDMNALLYYDQGGAEGRRNLRLYEWFTTEYTNDCTQTQKHKILKFNIILTSFEVF